MTPQEPVVCIVDDDAGVRDSLAMLLELKGFRTRVFASGEAFLAACAPDWNGCVVLDLRMPGKSGLEVQAAMAERALALPVIIVTAHGDIAAARASLKAGAVDFIEKPIDDAQLVAAIRAAFERDAGRRAQAAERARIERQLAELTAREREVLERVIDGRHNREIAGELGISVRTVEVYKARMMAKLQVRRVPDLIRLILGARGGPDRTP